MRKSLAFNKFNSITRKCVTLQPTTRGQRPPGPALGPPGQVFAERVLQLTTLSVNDRLLMRLPGLPTTLSVNDRLLMKSPGLLTTLSVNDRLLMRLPGLLTTLTVLKPSAIGSLEKLIRDWKLIRIFLCTLRVVVIL